MTKRKEVTISSKRNFNVIADQSFLTENYKIESGNLIRIGIAPAVAAIVETTLNGGTSWNDLKDGAEVPIGSTQIFEMVTSKGDLFNMRLKERIAGTINNLTVELFFEH